MLSRISRPLAVASLLTLALGEPAIAIERTWTGAASNVWRNAGNDTNWSGAGGKWGNGDSAVFNNTNTGNQFSISVHTSGLTQVGVTFNNTSASYSFSGGTIGGTGAITLAGSGLVTLNSANTFTGGVALNGGTLVVGHNDALGSSGTISFDGGTLQYGSGVTTDFSSRFSTATGQDYRIDTNGQNVTFASGLGSSTGQLNKLGNGVVTMNGTSTSAGDTRITAGTLRLGASERIGNASRLVMAGGTFDANGFDEIAGTVQLLENSTIDLGSGDAVLQFDESSAEAWTAGKKLTIVNWSNDMTGTGSDRLYIGTATNGLTSQQLAQIEFVNPEGMAPGTYGAMILSDGQVVAPEPASLGLIALGGTALLARRRRRV